MKYLVQPPSCFGQAEFRTRLKLILHNNACAVNRDRKTKTGTETSTRCLTARVINQMTVLVLLYTLVLYIQTVFFVIVFGGRGLTNKGLQIDTVLTVPGIESTICLC